MNLRLFAAKYTLGMLPSDDLPSIAAALLVDGVESQSLACLAGSLRYDSPADRRELFEKGLKECAVVVPGRLEAAHEVKLHVAGQVGQRELDPAQGVAQIVGLYHAVYELLPPSQTYAGDSFGIARLLGLYTSLDDIATDDPRRGDIEGDILRECRRIAEPETA